MVQYIRKRFFYILFDLLLVLVSYVLVVLIKGGDFSGYFSSRYAKPLIIFLGIWPGVSWVFRKYAFGDYNKIKRLLFYIIVSNFLILGTVSILVYFLNIFYPSRLLVLGTVTMATSLELCVGVIYHFVKVAQVHGEPVDHEYVALKKHKLNGNNNYVSREPEPLRPLPESFAGLITREAGVEAADFISRHNHFGEKEILVLVTSNPFNVRAQSNGYHKYIINLRRINDIRYINKFFETVNESLPDHGYYTCCVETKDMRKQRLFCKYPFPVNFLYYYLVDFPMKRVMPKLRMTRGLYFMLTRGQNRVVTRAETLGRLISCGFRIVDEDYIGNLCYITTEKIKTPAYDPDPSYGPLIRLKRVGRDGEIIRVYKMRTMHPFAEYLQEYIYEHYDLDKGGKFSNDFRISTQGRVMRKLWIDELPMLINWMKGEMKLVGVRPISRQYFYLYSEEHRRLRIKHKPGLVPPYYADMPKTLEEIETSERKYLLSYEKKPFITDWRYFWKAMYNIVFRKARSK